MTALTACPADGPLPDVDAFVFAIADDAGTPRPAAGAVLADRLIDGRLAATLKVLGASTAPGAVTLFPAAAGSPIPLLVGAGVGSAQGDPAARRSGLRQAAGAAARALHGRGRAAFCLVEGGLPESAGLAGVVAEAALLGAYSFVKYRARGAAGATPLGEVMVPLADPGSGSAQELMSRSRLVAECVGMARDLVNEPPNILYPESLAERCHEVALRYQLAEEVLGPAELAAGNYGGILAVGAASAHPPRLVRLRWAPDGARAHLALVGKGITYDSGGLSLKARERLPAMKLDMAGAAGVLGAISAAAGLNLPVTVTAYLPLAENLVGGAGARPGDVITMHDGTHVEIRNTDAEGRLVLADALCRAATDGPDAVVTVATLTGAQRVALGDRTSGVMGHSGLVRLVVQAGQRVGEPMWPMPLPDDVVAQLKSDVADLTNWNPGTSGGLARGGLFLSRFIPGGLPWAHLDIAGPAFNAGRPYGDTPAGGTGVPTRTLVDLISAAAEAPESVTALGRDGAGTQWVW